MKFFMDTEFIEDGRTIDLISIGIVSEDGRTYYAENSECNLSRASQWVRDNVFPHLRANGTGIVKPREQIGKDIVEFVGEKPEFWAYYADYDWVALCQLYGTMMDLPKGWPMYCRDFKQELDDHGNPRVVKLDENAAHDALADAVWLRDVYTAMHELWDSEK